VGTGFGLNPMLDQNSTHVYLILGSAWRRR
jgi:hypothetical protein